MMRPILVVTSASLIVVAALHAECFSMTAKQALSESGVELVFAGRVVDIQDVGQSGSRVTFEVQRVWKGSVPAHIDLYYERFAVEGPEYTKGQYAVARAALIRDSVSRNRFGLSQSSAPTEYRAFNCWVETDFEKNLGSSHPPKR